MCEGESRSKNVDLPFLPCRIPSSTPSPSGTRSLGSFCLKPAGNTVARERGQKDGKEGREEQEGEKARKWDRDCFFYDGQKYNEKQNIKIHTFPNILWLFYAGAIKQIVKHYICCKTTTQLKLKAPQNFPTKTSVSAQGKLKHRWWQNQNAAGKLHQKRGPSLTMWASRGRHFIFLSAHFKAGSEMRADLLCYWRSCVSVGEGRGLDWGCASRRCCHSRCPGSVWRGEAKVRGQPHTDTTHRAHCEETLTGWGGRTQDFRNSLCFCQPSFI